MRGPPERRRPAAGRRDRASIILTGRLGPRHGTDQQAARRCDRADAQFHPQGDRTRHRHGRRRSTSAPAPVPAAAERSIRSARPSAKCWIMCRRACACCASAAPNTAAAPAVRSTRRRRPSGRSQKGSQAPVCWPMCWSASTATTFRCTANRRSSPARGSISTARPWRTGSAAPHGGWRRCACGWPTIFSPRTSCSRTTRRSRCWIPAAAGPEPGGSGLCAR